MKKAQLAMASAAAFTGTPSTSFADFALTQPRVPVVLSVADTTQLECRFALLRENP